MHRKSNYKGLKLIFEGGGSGMLALEMHQISVHGYRNLHAKFCSSSLFKSRDLCVQTDKETNRGCLKSLTY